MTISGFLPEHVATEAAICFKTFIALGAHAPDVSATIGIKSMPASEHKPCVFRWAFLCSD